MEDSTKHTEDYTEDYTEDIYAYINRYIYVEDYNGKLHYIYLENYTNIKPTRKNQPHGRTTRKNLHGNLFPIYVEDSGRSNGKQTRKNNAEDWNILNGRIERKKHTEGNLFPILRKILNRQRNNSQRNN